MELTHGSLFSGIGGFELGAKWAGIDTIWNCEYEPDCRQLLKKHFPDTKQYDNILTMQNAPYVDIISGGFPCQDISLANASNKNINERGINGNRSGLWSEMWRIVRQTRPQYVIFENSPALTFRRLETVLCDFTKSGYMCEWQCIEATSFGFPHKRARIYGVAFSNDFQKRCNGGTKIFKSISELSYEIAPRQIPASMPTERFDSKSDFGNARIDNGFPEKLDAVGGRRRIEMLGNAVIPQITQYLFECIKIHYSENQ